MCTFPLYKLASIHGSLGWRSTHFTRSDLAESFRFMSNRSGCKVRKCEVKQEGYA